MTCEYRDTRVSQYQSVNILSTDREKGLQTCRGTPILGMEETITEKAH